MCIRRHASASEKVMIAFFYKITACLQSFQEMWKLKFGSL